MIFLVGMYVGAGAMILWWLLLSRPLVFVAMFVAVTAAALAYRLVVELVQWHRLRVMRRAVRQPPRARWVN